MKTLIASQMYNAPGSVELDFDAALIRKYDRSGPRYTSYPTADRFVEAFTTTNYALAVKNRGNTGLIRPLSLYFHLPFCATICFYCGCNKIVTRDRSKAEQYVKYLAKEMAIQHELLQPHVAVGQLHWGGGTPTFLSHAQMRELMHVTRQQFDLAADGEYSIELDPRTVDADTVGLLAELGFNRISLGVQDFDDAVQRAVNRVQSAEETKAVIDAARGFGFKSVSVDLIYGLPKQSVQSFARTLDQVVALNPDRVSIYNYAHLPLVFKPQRRIDEAELPSAAEKLNILHVAIESLTHSGYHYIGMDHFAKPQDELTIAQRLGRLQRNFQGYSTHADYDLVAMGVTAISHIMPTYSQNLRGLSEYYDRLDQGILPVMRGIEMGRDDRLRWAIIQSLMCHFMLSVQSIEFVYFIDFKVYFERELEELRTMEQDGLLELSKDWIEVTPKGRLLIRNICMVFDQYLRRDRERMRYSKAI
ncbi:MAG: oxygen-independent coproporphyrinogen III oxidase [Burkholderiales bacterium]